MEIRGSKVYLTNEEERLMGMPSPVDATIAFAQRDALMARSQQLSEQFQSTILQRSETYNESRWACARQLGRALRAGHWGMAAKAVVPALTQAASPDSEALRTQTERISAEANAYGNLSNALRHGETMKAKALAITEADTVATADEMVSAVEDYLTLQDRD